MRNINGENRTESQVIEEILRVTNKIEKLERERAALREERARMQSLRLSKEYADNPEPAFLNQGW